MSEQVRVLVADDSRFTRKMVGSCFADTEFDIVAEATTGSEAVTLYKEHSPDVTILDIIMPDQEGHEALEEIIQLNPSAKVIMLSSLGTEDMVTRCLEIGAATFVQKPFTKDTLLAQLRTIVSQ